MLIFTNYNIVRALGIIDKVALNPTFILISKSTGTSGLVAF